MPHESQSARLRTVRSSAVLNQSLREAGLATVGWQVREVMVVAGGEDGGRGDYTIGL